MTSKVRIVRLIQTDEVRGQGVEGDPVRRVVQLWNLSGVLVAEYDPETKESSFYGDRVFQSSP